MSITRSLAISIALAAAACSSPAPASDDAAVDAPTDAGVDAPTDAPGATTHRIELSSGGRLTGAALVVDVQLGAPIVNQPAAGGTLVVAPAPAIAP